MKKDIAFLAIGQAGGNIGKLFEEQCFKVMYVNTSMEDLNTLLYAKHVYHITNGEGAARDRERAKELLMADIQDLQNEITKTLSEEFIFVIFSAGGGTGSGIAPMLMAYMPELLPDSKICGITILPSVRESLQTQANAAECFHELEGLDIDSLFVIDNNGRPDKFAINETFVDLFMNMLKIPGYTDSRGNIDTRDLKDALSAKGCVMISALPSIQSSTPKLLDSFRNGIFAQPEPDGKIQYIALSMATEINTDAFIKIVGKPLDLFQGYNRESTVCVLSGLSLPYPRLIGIEALVLEEKSAMKKVWDVKNPTLSHTNIDLDFMRKREKTRTAKTADEVFSMFCRH